MRQNVIYLDCHWFGGCSSAMDAMPKESFSSLLVHGGRMGCQTCCQRRESLNAQSSGNSYHSPLAFWRKGFGCCRSTHWFQHGPVLTSTMTDSAPTMEMESNDKCTKSQMSRGRT